MNLSFETLRSGLAARRETAALHKIAAACGLSIPEFKGLTNGAPRTLTASILDNRQLIPVVLNAVYGGEPAEKFSLIVRLIDGCSSAASSAILKSFPGIMRLLGGSATFEQFQAISQQVAKTDPEERALVMISFERMLKIIAPEVSPAMLGKFIRGIDCFLPRENENFMLLYGHFPEVLGLLARPLTPDSIEAAHRFLAGYVFKGEIDASRQFRVPATLRLLSPNITAEHLRGFTSLLVNIPREYYDQYDLALATAVENITSDGSDNLPVTAEQLCRLGRFINGLLRNGRNLGSVLTDLPILFEQLHGAVSEASVNRIGEILDKSPLEPWAAINYIVGSIEVLRGSLAPVATLELIAANARGEPVPDSEIARQFSMVAELASLVFDPAQSFARPKNEFYERLRGWKSRVLLPAIVVNDKTVRCRYRANADDYRVIKGKQLNRSLFINLIATISDKQMHADAMSSVFQLLGVASWREVPGAESERSAVVIALRMLEGQRQAFAIKALRGSILSVSGVVNDLPLANSGDSQVKHYYDLLSSVVQAYEGHLSDWFRQNSINLSPESQLVLSRFVKGLKDEQNKIRVSGEFAEIEVELVATKIIYDAFYDAIGENCICDYGFSLSSPVFQPIRLKDRVSKQHVGVVYALKGRVDGIPALVLAGVELRKIYAYSIKPIGRFIERLVDRLDEVALENGLTGGVWSTVGEPDESNGLTWTDDGRIGQYDLVRQALVGLGLSRGGRESFKTLSTEEQIQFPPQFDRPISRVIKLSRATAT